MVTGDVIRSGDQDVGVVSGSQSVFASVSPESQEVVGVLASGFSLSSGTNVFASISPADQEIIGILTSCLTPDSEETIIASISPAYQEVVGTLTSSLAPYSGENVVTPTESTQILNTSGKSMSMNVIINPIPDNYARMSWDGTVLHFY